MIPTMNILDESVTARAELIARFSVKAMSPGFYGRHTMSINPVTAMTKDMDWDLVAYQARIWGGSGLLITDKDLKTLREHFRGHMADSLAELFNTTTDHYWKMEPYANWLASASPVSLASFAATGVAYTMPPIPKSNKPKGSRPHNAWWIK